MSYFDNLKERFPILVPYWIETQLHRKQIPMDCIFDLEKFAEHFSPEDIAIIMAMNSKYASSFYGIKYEGYNATNILEYWRRNQNAVYLKYEPLMHIYSDSIDARLITSQMCVVRANTIASPTDVLPLEVPQYSEPFKIIPISPAQYLTRQSALAIVVYPGYFGGEHFRVREYQNSLVRAYLRQSYVFSDYDVVARSPLFAQYMRTCIAEPA